MNLDHVLGFFGGSLIVILLFYFTRLLLGRRVEGRKQSRSGRDSNTGFMEQSSEPTQPPFTRQIASTCDSSTHFETQQLEGRVENQPSTRAPIVEERTREELWKANCQRVLRKHNDLVQKYNKLLHNTKSLFETNKQELDRQTAECNRWANVFAEEERAKEMWKGRYEKAIERFNGVVGKYNNLVKEYNQLNESFKTQLDQLRNRILILEQENKQFSDREQVLLQTLESTLQEKPVVPITHNELIEEKRRLNEAIQAQGNQVGMLQARIQNLERGSQELRTHTEVLREQLQDLERTKRDLASQLSNLELANQNLARDLRNEQQQSLVLRQEMQSLTQQRDRYKKEQEELAVHNQKLLQENHTLTQEVVRLRQEHETLQKRLREFKPDSPDKEEKQQVYPDQYEGRVTAPGLRSGKQEQPVPDLPIAIPSRVRAEAINLGFDFGTHSTKVILRVRNDQLGIVLFLDEAIPGYPPFASPSVVRLNDDKLYFGSRALKEKGGKLFKSLKVSLLPVSTSGGWDSSDYPPGTSPDLLVSLYLSWLLSRLKDALGEVRSSKLSLNLAAPMGHLEDEKLKERYLQVIHAAWQAAIAEAAPRVIQGQELRTVAPVFKELLDRPVPDIDTRRFEVLPETLAPLVSLSQDPQTPPGFYMMVDMGAGSTELSVSLVNYNASALGITCHADLSVLLGGDHFTENDQDNKENSKAHADQENTLTEQLKKEFRKTWYMGFQTDKAGGPAAKAQWKQLHVILSGGGMRRSGLQEMLEANSPLQRIFPDEPTYYTVDWHYPTGLEDGTTGSQFSYTDSLSYLAVAHGLSLEWMKWPAFYFPGDIQHVQIESRTEDPYERRYVDSDVG